MSKWMRSIESSKRIENFESIFDTGRESELNSIRGMFEGMDLEDEDLREVREVNSGKSDMDLMNGQEVEEHILGYNSKENEQESRLSEIDDLLKQLDDFDSFSTSFVQEPKNSHLVLDQVSETKRGVLESQKEQQNDQEK